MLEPPNMEADRYEIQQKIGQGSFGIIRKVRRISDGKEMARKEINYHRMTQKEREQLQAELQILKGLRHPNIVAYYEREHIKSTGELHIYMEYCEQGDLGMKIKELRRTGQVASEDFVWSIFAQLITALYRCHYGEDPPEVSNTSLGLAPDARPARLSGGRNNHMILHRDLKPENIFLGADASVKLGDFGLSKIMASNDFASTYVGTPFYMSPEICAAENYSLHSDIWAFGCIMYELCAKSPPFNAKTHLELINKIRLGKVDTNLSSCYSQDLKDAIYKCLRTNPATRPDTVQLLNLPMVKLKRKEQDIVRASSAVKQREEKLLRLQNDLEQKLNKLETEHEAARVELDNSLRREWEVKARLEIDRQVQIATQSLYDQFDAEVKRRVEEAVQSVKKESQVPTQETLRSSTPDPEDLPANIETYGYQRSYSTSGENSTDFPSSTDLSELSLESPTLEKRSKPLKKATRTPFGRAQTMFVASPMDVQMGEPSPAPIGNYGLSPRQDTKHRYRPSNLGGNIFINDAKACASDESDDEVKVLEDDVDDLDEVLALPSPSVRKQGIGGDPFKTLNAQRPNLMRLKTAPQKPIAQPALFSVSKKENIPPSSLTATSKTSQAPPRSPTRHMSKLPSAHNLANIESTSPVRKANTGLSRQNTSSSGMPRPVSRKRDDTHSGNGNAVQGKTLVELNRAMTAVQDFASIGRSQSELRLAPVWDPETDEMPSPFIRRGIRHTVVPGSLGGPGFKHLR